MKINDLVRQMTWSRTVSRIAASGAAASAARAAGQASQDLSTEASQARLRVIQAAQRAGLSADAVRSLVPAGANTADDKALLQLDQRLQQISHLRDQAQAQPESLAALRAALNPSTTKKNGA